MAIRQINIDTSAGTGTGTCEKFRGRIESIRLDFNASTPATADTTITLDGVINETLLAISNTNTDATYHPSHELTDIAGVGRATYDKFFSDWQSVTVTVAEGGTVTDAVIVYISFSDYGGR